MFLQEYSGVLYRPVYIFPLIQGQSSLQKIRNEYFKIILSFKTKTYILPIGLQWI